MGWQAGMLGEGLEADGRRAVEGMATRVQRRGRREGDGVVGDDAPPGDGQGGGVLSWGHRGGTFRGRRGRCLSR